MSRLLFLVAMSALIACSGDDKDTDTAGDPTDTTGGATGGTTGGATGGSTGTTTGGSSTGSTTGTNSSTTVTGSTSTTSLPLGPADAIAQKGCDLLLGTSDSLTAVTSQFDAGQVLIQPSDTLAHSIALPATGDGFLSLAVGEWDTTQAFFTFVDNELITWVPDGMQAGPLQLNGACPTEGITDRRIYFEHWTDVVLAYTDVGPRDAWLAVVKVSP